MKITYILSLCLGLGLCPCLLYPQDNARSPGYRDGFIDFILRMSQIKGMTYASQLRQKDLFETDTSFSEATVTLYKSGDSIQYIHVAEKETRDELLFLNDTVWCLHAARNEWKQLGDGIDNIRGNRLSEYVPFNLFLIRYSGGQVEPFWEITEEKDTCFKVNLEIQHKPKELSEITVSILIGKDDHLLYQIQQNAYFTDYPDYQYKEISFRDYHITEEDQVLPPLSFTQYPGKMSSDNRHRKPESQPAAEADNSIHLSDLRFETLNGMSFQMPEDGLIFLDLWYAGCFPCLKSAPVMEMICREYQDDIHFYSVNEIDTDTQKIHKFMDAMKLSFPVLLNRHENISQRVGGINSYPLFILLEAGSGRILWHRRGYSEDLEEVIRKVLSEHLH